MAPTGQAVKALLPSWARPLLDRFHVDFVPARRQPRPSLVVVATLLSVVGSLAADALLVKLGTTVFPATRGYVHFELADYGKLTVVGVLIACAGWPIVTRITSLPRWVFFRMAIAVTLVLWLPDAWLFFMHNPPDAVAVLMLMHLAIAVVTYNLLVRIAPVDGPLAGRPVAPRDPLGARAVRVR